MVGDDGFILIKPSITDFLEKAGIDEATKKKFENYDDWYLMGVPDKNGNITYSMFKYREISETEQGGLGTAVPFLALDMDTFSGFFRSDSGKATADQLQTTLDKCVYSTKHISEYDQNMLDYFKNPKSDGSYLIADFISEKAAEQLPFDDNNQYKLPYKYNEFEKYSQGALDELESLRIYNKKTNTITINKSNGLSEDEKRALLVVTTGDPDKYAYAAENQYHADKFMTSRADLGKLSSTNKSAIASDAGVGESFWASFYEDKFKSEKGCYYKQQMEAHGGK